MPEGGSLRLGLSFSASSWAPAAEEAEEAEVRLLRNSDICARFQCYSSVLFVWLCYMALMELGFCARICYTASILHLRG